MEEIVSFGSVRNALQCVARGKEATRLPGSVPSRSCRYVIACLFSVGSSLGLCACDPMFGFYGTVRDAKGLPIGNATVEIVCDAVTQNRTTTDMDGAFKGSGIGWRSDDCSVLIAGTGYRGALYSVGKSCIKRPSHLQNACLALRVDATLAEVGGLGP